MNYQGALDLNRAAEMLRDEPDIRLVLIKGSGRAFCTGIDLKQLTAGETPTTITRAGTGLYEFLNSLRRFSSVPCTATL